MPPLAAVPSLGFLAELAAVFGAVAVVTYLCLRLRIVPIVGFLMTGVAVGPDALGLVENAELVAQLAEIGVILLLFTIGLEFHLQKLLRMRRYLAIGGGLQVLVTGGIAAGLGWAFGLGGGEAVFTGMLIALSSTALVVKLLADRRETDTPKGRIALGVLIFQDLATIAMVLFLPLLAAAGSSGSLLATLEPLLWALLLVGGILLLAQRVMPRLLDGIAESQSHELLLLSVVALCLVTTWVAYLAGVSLALGAFLAGLMVSESRFRDHILGEMMPLQIVFSALFFVSMGMLLDLDVLAAYLPELIGLSAAVALGKTAIAAGAVLVLGYPLRIAITTGFTLSQIGEFSFVLAQAGLAAGLLPFGIEAGYPLLVGVAVLLMVATPFLEIAGERLARWVESAVDAGDRAIARSEKTGAQTEAPSGRLEDHVIVSGFGPAGRRITAALKESGIPLSVVEMNPALAEEARAADLDVHLGDVSRRAVLEEAGIRRAKMVVLTINEGSMLARIVQTCRLLNPTAQIVVRTRFQDTVPELTASGADLVIPEELETTVRILGEVLRAYRVPEEEIRRHQRVFRSDGYEALREDLSEAHRMVLDGLSEEGLHTRAVHVREGARAAGKTLSELNLRRDYGLTVLTVRRDGEAISNPAGSFRIESDDRLVLMGEAEEFGRCAEIFRS